MRERKREEKEWVKRQGKEGEQREEGEERVEGSSCLQRPLLSLT